MYAQKMVDFLQGCLPIKAKSSKQLISANEKDNTYNYTYSYILDIPKICKDDLVLIHPKLAKMLGGSGLMLLCYKVTTYLHMIDLSNYRTLQLSKQQYDLFETKFEILPFNKFKTQFEVLNSEPYNSYGKQNLNQSISNLLDHKLYETVITRTTKCEELYVRCHLGELQAGQMVEGYDLRFMTYNDSISDYPGVPEVILVRRLKDTEKKRKRKVRRLEDEGIEVEGEKKKNKKDKKDDNQEFEEFLDEMDDPEEDEKGKDIVEVLKKVEKQEERDATKE